MEFLGFNEIFMGFIGFCFYDFIRFFEFFLRLLKERDY